MTVTSLESSAALLSSVGPAPTGQAGLEAQQRLLERKLSDCVNCDSARTPEGKAEIEAITAKLTEVKEKLKVTSDANGAGDSSRGRHLEPPTFSGGGALAAALETPNRSDKPLVTRIGPEGGYIDTHA